MKKQEVKKRESSIELFRIITMIVIVAHHYVFNSGLMDAIITSETLKFNHIFLLLFGWGGKIGINCFVLITGYFMCKSSITLKKFLKLFLEIEFYTVLIYIVFVIFGYSDLTLKGIIKALFPFSPLNSNNFTGCYMLFFLFIPFLNILINNLNKKQHFVLISLAIIIYSLLPSAFIELTFSYIGWFMIVYLIASYIRLYPLKWFSNKKICTILCIFSVLISLGSVMFGVFLSKFLGKTVMIYYHFVIDSNKLLAIMTAVFAFLYFKNLNIKYSKTINLISASTFGVFLIHANSDLMRKFLWIDLFKNISFINSKYLVLHAILVVLGIYIVCTIIDILRIKLIERPFFNFYEKNESRLKKCYDKLNKKISF